MPQYPEIYSISSQNYEEPNYGPTVESSDQQRYEELLEIQQLLQNVLQAIKIFDIPYFYNDPKLSLIENKNQFGVR